MRIRGGIWKTLLISYVMIFSVFLLTITEKSSGLSDYTGDYTDAFITTSGSLTISQPEFATFTLDPYYDGEWRYFKFEGLIARFNNTRNAVLNLMIENKGEEVGYIESRAVIDYDADGFAETQILFPRRFINVVNGSTTWLNLIPEHINGDLLNISSGIIHLMLRQEAKPLFMPAIHIGEGSLLRLPYDRDYLIAHAGKDINGREGVEIEIQGDVYNPMNRDLTYLWDFDQSDGLTWDAEGSSVKYTYQNEGNYIVTLNVSDRYQYSHDRTVVNVRRSTPPVPNHGGNRTVYRNDLVKFDASRSYDDDGDPMTFRWILPDGSEGTGIFYNYRFSDPGNYDVILSISDGFHTINETINVIVRNRPPEIISIDYSVPRIGHPMTFNASIVNDHEGDPLDGFHWDFGDGSFGEGRIVNYTYFESGDFTVTLSVFDGYDNGTGEIEFLIPENGKPTAKALQQTIYTCVGKNTFFFTYESEDPESHPLNYTWDFGDGTNDTGWMGVHEYDEPGTYEAVLTIRDIVGDLSTDEITVEVLDHDTFYPEEIKIEEIYHGTHGVLPPVRFYYYYYSTSDGETYWIPREDEGYRAFRIYMTPGKWFDIDFQITEGSEVDGLIMNGDQYDEYVSSQVVNFEYVQYETILQGDEWSYRLEGGKVVYLVIDNNNKMKSRASPDGYVLFDLSISESNFRPEDNDGDADADYQLSNPMLVNSVCCIIIGAILLVIFIPIYYSLRSSSLKREKDHAVSKKVGSIDHSGSSGSDIRISRSDNDGINTVSGFQRRIDLDPVSVGVSYNRIQGAYDNREGSKISGGIRIGGVDDRKISASGRIEDDPDIMGSTDIDALVYDDEEFDIKQTEDWQRSIPNKAEGASSTGKITEVKTEGKEGPRIAPPPPEW